MNLYDSWFYIFVLNTEWYVSFLITLVVIFNFLSPILFVVILRHESRKNREEQQEQTREPSGSI